MRENIDMMNFPLTILESYDDFEIVRGDFLRSKATSRASPGIITVLIFSNSSAISRSFRLPILLPIKRMTRWGDFLGISDSVLKKFSAIGQMTKSVRWSYIISLFLIWISGDI